MMSDWIYLLVGLSLLIVGGDLLVRGATAMARRLGVSPLVIGLTIVAMGTSAPELAVNIIAVLKNQPGISFGNIIGSNIANTAFILGASALMMPLVVKPDVLRREIPIMLTATLIAVLTICDGLFGGVSEIGRLDGLILIIGFVIFLYFTFRRARRDRQAAKEVEQTTEEAEHGRHPRMVVASLLTLAGLVAVLLGSDWTVKGAEALAHALGVSDAVIGLSIVAIGTSLPELVACLAAVKAGHPELAVGNVVGSNIFNLLLVLGPTAMIRPIPLPAGGVIDLVVLGVVSVALIPMFLLGQRRISRTQGLILLVGYWVYLAWRTLG
jgi:cation:H+ antiporter